MTTIILTSTVNINDKKICIFQRDSDSRIQAYLKSVHQWLYKTNFNIILVENSGYTFEELKKEKELFKDRFEVITLTDNQEPKFLRNNRSKGASEIYSIHYAFKHSKLIQPSSFIIKITARFFIPELESYLQNFDLTKYQCLTQYDRDRCEMVGCHYSYFSIIFNIYLLDIKGYDGHIEDIWKLRTYKCKKVLVCKPFQFEPTCRGGVNEVFSTI